MSARKGIVVCGLTIGLLALTTACGTQSAAGAANSAASSNQTGQAWSTSGHGNFKGGYGMGMGMADNANVAKILGISTTTLQNDLKANKSIAQIASSKGISEATLTKDLEASFKKQMDSLVKSGKISSSQEQQMISRYDSTIKTTIERKGLPQRPPHAGNWGNRTANGSATN
ncbi:hypothetical protein NZD89_26800 [Alicyclobacillus fastidiosus]|uniref:Lipoprotein n=1 Tax=Alicyclobacillus fastidiosus TaxID=392011 RepID=A0ABY6ZI15_9BACL|nr:hypothetical protein [Alicyclobacillus fastidiosus]WAH41771.1 hypothetical protein NZD89_26800 [Alicyclobacillus fastidiosus]